uniref:Integrase catalytic domain-containing protein n=1 Tax=Nicotiana tabacum TaxID=4097 RepID=A0A1S3ZHV0_TOBAC|nr:PREDICTED: uncharacterized protein LOC107787023 [Nicotiana tabacum]
MAINTEDSRTTPADATAAPIIDQHHPLFLQPSDTPGSSLISVKLTGPANYTLWSSTMHIMNSVSDELLSDTVYISSAHKVWMDLKEIFDKVNGSRVLFLHKQIATLTQGISSVSTYFSKLKELWAEFDALMPCLGCGCEESKKYVEHVEYQRFLQFLMGLNETYSQSSNQILNMSSRPSINKAYSMIISEESRRVLAQPLQVTKVHDVTALFSSKGANSFVAQLNNKSNIGHNHTYLGDGMTHTGATTLFSNKNNAGSGYNFFGGNNHSVSNYRSRKDSLHCDYCNFKGHTRENCYKLHGYPSDFKSKKKGGFGTANFVQGNTGNYPSETLSSSNTGQAGSTVNFAGISQMQQTNQSFQAGIPQFTQEQYNQILQLLGKQTECSGSAITACMPSCADITEILTKWIVDSGASSHMVNRYNLLTNAKAISNDKGKSALPTGSIAKIRHIGSAYLLKDLNVSNVMHIPDFKFNLLSVSKLTKEMKWVVMFFPDFFIFQELFSGQVRGIDREKDGLYVFNFTTGGSVVSQVSAEVKDSIPRPIPINVHSASVKYFRSDNGCEFFNSQMTDLLQSLGIVHQSSCVYTPQHNGVAERRHRYILETARAHRFQAAVPLRFWGSDLFPILDSFTFLSIPPPDSPHTSIPSSNTPFSNSLPTTKASSPVHSDAGLPQEDCPVSTLPSTKTRKSAKTSRPPIWLKAYVSLGNGNIHYCYPIYDMITYANVSPFFATALAVYSAITEPKTYNEAMKDPR